jgi:hypothetical protein
MRQEEGGEIRKKVEEIRKKDGIRWKMDEGERKRYKERVMEIR